MIKSLRVGSDPNSTVRNAIAAGKMAHAERWKKFQAIPPPPLPSRPPSPRCTRPAAGHHSSGRPEGVRQVASPAAVATGVASALGNKSSSATNTADYGQTTANLNLDKARYNYENPNAAQQHRAGNAISGQMPQWAHIKHVPVKAVDSNVPAMARATDADIARAEASLSNATGVTSANHLSDISRYSNAHPNAATDPKQAGVQTSRQMPPYMRQGGYRRQGRVLRVASAATTSDVPPAANQVDRGQPHDADYYTDGEAGTVRRAGLSPRHAVVPRFHKDVHDGEPTFHDIHYSQHVANPKKRPAQPPSAKTKTQIVQPQTTANVLAAYNRFDFDNPNRPAPDQRSDTAAGPNERSDHTRDISAFSDNCPDWMHIPGVPTVPARYRKGVRGAEVVSGASNASAYLRYDVDNPNMREQHEHEITVVSAAAPSWMHSEQHHKTGVRGYKWRKPEPATANHNVAVSHARNPPGDKGHNYHYDRAPDRQRIAYDTRRENIKKLDPSTGVYRHMPHSSVVSQHGPAHFAVRGIPLVKFPQPKSHMASAGSHCRNLRPQTADTPRAVNPTGRAARRGAVSFDAPPFMKVPGVIIARGPVPGMEPMVIGQDRNPQINQADLKRVRKKLATGRARARVNPQQQHSSVLGQAPANPDGSPITPREPSPAQRAAMARARAAHQLMVPARPSTVGSRTSGDGRDGACLGSRRSRSVRARKAALTVPYATHYPVNPHAPVPFWEKMRQKRQRQQREQQGQPMASNRPAPVPAPPPTGPTPAAPKRDGGGKGSGEVRAASTVQV